MLVRRFTGLARFKVSHLASRVVMTHVWVNGIGVIGAIDANTLFVQRDPNDTGRTILTRGHHVKVRAALSIFERILVIPEIFHFRDGRDIAFSDGRDGLL